MKTLLLLLACLGLALPSFAQHSVTIDGYTDSVTGVNYNIYRTNCSAALVNGICPPANEGAFLKINTSPNLGPPYLDSTVVGGSVYSYYLTAFCVTCPPGYSTQESGPSAHAGASVPANIAPPPTGIHIGTVAYNFSQGTTTVAGEWTAPAGDVTTWYVLQGTFTLGTGTSFSPSGDFSMFWGAKGKIKPPLTLTVCDGTLCATKAAS